jgi:hypothetical protein
VIITTVRPVTPLSTRTRSGSRADLLAVAAGVALVVLAALVGRGLLAAGVDIFLGRPPPLAVWLPHTGARLSEAHDEWAAEPRASASGF